MTLALRRLKIEHFCSNQKSPLVDPADAFKVYGIVENRTNDLVFEDLRSLSNEADKKSARTALIKLLKHAENGPPLEKCFDSKQCHPIHQFLHQNDNIKIWRLWLAGVIRICFIYLPSNRIVILNILPKRQDSITKSQKGNLENLALDILARDKQSLLSVLEEKS